MLVSGRLLFTLVTRRACSVICGCEPGRWYSRYSWPAAALEEQLVTLWLSCRTQCPTARVWLASVLLTRVIALLAIHTSVPHQTGVIVCTCVVCCMRNKCLRVQSVVLLQVEDCRSDDRSLYSVCWLLLSSTCVQGWCYRYLPQILRTLQHVIVFRPAVSQTQLWRQGNETGDGLHMLSIAAA
jgi:hypothetical protein